MPTKIGSAGGLGATPKNNAYVCTADTVDYHTFFAIGSFQTYKVQEFAVTLKRLGG